MTRHVGFVGGTTFKYAHLDIVEKVLTGHCGWHSVCQGVNVFR